VCIRVRWMVPAKKSTILCVDLSALLLVGEQSGEPVHERLFGSARDTTSDNLPVLTVIVPRRTKYGFNSCYMFGRSNVLRAPEPSRRKVQDRVHCSRKAPGVVSVVI